MANSQHDVARRSAVGFAAWSVSCSMGNTQLVRYKLSCFQRLKGVGYWPASHARSTRCLLMTRAGKS